ncbi:MAG: fibronectin type III domain-containing protein [Lachnospiraceae bacterium]
MKTKWKVKGMVLFVLCSILITVMPAKEVKAQNYLGTLKFGESYNFDETDGMRKYDVVLSKSGRIRINFIANTSDSMGIFWYNDNQEICYENWAYSGSFNDYIDLKAGRYTLIFSGSTLFWGGKPQDSTPATGIMIASFEDSKETYKEDELETNDEYGVASEIKSINKTKVLGQLAVNDSIDYYSFDVKNSQNVTIKYKSPFKSSSVHLFKSSLDLETWEQDLASGSHKIALTLPKGHYYLAIENGNNSITGQYMLEFSTKKLPAVTLKKVTSTAAKTINVSYGKAAVGAYQIQIAKDSKFTKSAKTYTCTGTSKTIKNLQANQTYYVRVRTVSYANSGAKQYNCYSDWSNAKKIKVKKK